jgi:hypothetical protein
MNLSIETRNLEFSIWFSDSSIQRVSYALGEGFTLGSETDELFSDPIVWGQIEDSVLRSSFQSLVAIWVGNARLQR